MHMNGELVLRKVSARTLSHGAPPPRLWSHAPQLWAPPPQSRSHAPTLAEPRPLSCGASPSVIESSLRTGPGGLPTGEPLKHRPTPTCSVCPVVSAQGHCLGVAAQLLEAHHPSCPDTRASFTAGSEQITGVDRQVPGLGTPHSQPEPGKQKGVWGGKRPLLIKGYWNKGEPGALPLPHFPHSCCLRFVVVFGAVRRGRGQGSGRQQESLKRARPCPGQWGQTYLSRQVERWGGAEHGASVGAGEGDVREDRDRLGPPARWGPPQLLACLPSYEDCPI